jgi:2,4-dienoyl-CoA reductase (NADPH2)
MRLGKTSGWVHRWGCSRPRACKWWAAWTTSASTTGACTSLIDGKERVLDVDDIVICAGQEPLRALLAPLRAAGKTPHLIGGADVATELDAKRAIAQGSELAAAF